ncbi:hypothetical protein ACOMHN_051249 [Nucella lapillus]
MGLPNEPEDKEQEGVSTDHPPDLKKTAVELRDELTLVASDLDTHTKNVNISRVTGGSAAIAGIVTGVVGFVLIPFTAGVSALAAGITGASVAAAGGLTAGGASITKIFIEKSKLKPLLEKWNDFNKMLAKELQEQDPEMLEKLKNGLELRMAHMGTAGIAGTFLGATATTARAGVSAARTLNVGAAVAGGVASRVATLAFAGSFVLNVVLVGVSLYDVIDGSIQLHKETGSKAGDYLRQLAQSLDDFARVGLTEDLLVISTSGDDDADGSG